MPIDIEAHDREGVRWNCRIDKNPDGCPICHHGIQPVDARVSFYSSRSNHGLPKLQRILLCPREECEHYFIAHYWQSIHTSGYFELNYCVPLELQDVELPDSITTISKDFCEIYNQAYKAERRNLLLVAGPGYRKALEFLLKDYVSLLHPQEVENIRKMLLAACIEKYVNNDKVKSTASRAVWLGNDETHYVRKWEKTDLEDLKKFIRLTVHWIEMEELTKEGEKAMPRGRK
jgi:hypothetical protein